jgi:outer membrane protein TolC
VVLQSKNNYLNDRADFLNQEVIVRNAIRNLNFMMGEEPVIAWDFTDGFEHSPNDYALGELLDKTMSNNNTLRNQFVRLKLEQTQTELARGDYMPSLSFSAGANDQFNSLSGDGSRLNSNSLSPYANISLSYNIYSGGNRKRAMEIARINEDIANIEIEQMKHSITNQLMNELDSYNARKVMLEVASESLEAADLNLTIAEEKLRTGTINSFNYRDIQIIYLNSAINRLSAIYNLIASNTTLTRLTGGFVND